MEQDLSILTERQKTAWELRERGMTYAAIAKEMGITSTAVRTHIVNAERRFREYEYFNDAKEKNAELLTLDMTRGEVKLLVDALLNYEKELLAEAHLNVKTDWKGRIPYRGQVAATLLYKLQETAYGQVLYKSVLTDRSSSEPSETD